MASTSISDPFVLSSYTSSSRGKLSQKNAPGIYATSYSKSNSADGFVTVAAKADGLHIVDVGHQLMLLVSRGDLSLSDRYLHFTQLCHTRLVHQHHLHVRQ